MPTRKQARRTAPERVGGLRDEKERREALETHARAFTTMAHMEGELERGLWAGKLPSPEHTRVAVADGRVVSMLAMSPRMLRFGPVMVPAMTIGPVATHDRYRKRGYAAAVMNDASRYMQEHGVLLAYLNATPDFYYRFGYWPYTVVSEAVFKREAAEGELRPGRLRKMRRQDLPGVRKLYDEVTADRIFAAVRDKKLWEWLVGPGTRSWLFCGANVILDARGRLCGYMAINPRRQDVLAIAESVVRQNEVSCRAALGALVREARRRELKEIRVSLPWDDALTVFLRQYVGVRFEMSSGPTGGWLLKVVDFPALMRRLEPLFTQRWKAGGALLPRTRFTLESEIGAVGLAAARSGVRVGEPSFRARVRVPQRWLSGLLTGYYAVREIAPRRGASIPRELARAMEILFPTGWPYCYQGDNQ